MPLDFSVTPYVDIAYESLMDLISFTFEISLRDYTEFTAHHAPELEVFTCY